MASLEPSSFLNASSMDALLVACSSSDFASLVHLLSTPEARSIALAREKRFYITSRIEFLNLVLLVERAARSGHASCVETLLAFGQANNIAYDALITRDTMMAALEGRNLEVLKTYITAMPSAADLELGHMQSPLAQTLIKDLYTHAEYLLEHGADPNSACAAHKGPVYYLRNAAWKLPLQYTELLLSHGAIVRQSGAMQMAAEKGRIDVLRDLIDHGGDVNERLELNVGFLVLSRKKQLASESLLHIAVNFRQVEMARWLLENGADAKVVDLRGKTARALAEEGGDREMIDVFAGHSTV